MTDIEYEKNVIEMRVFGEVISIIGNVKFGIACLAADAMVHLAYDNRENIDDEHKECVRKCMKNGVFTDKHDITSIICSIGEEGSGFEGLNTMKENVIQYMLYKQSLDNFIVGTDDKAKDRHKMVSRAVKNYHAIMDSTEPNMELFKAAYNVKEEGELELITQNKLFRWLEQDNITDVNKWKIYNVISSIKGNINKDTMDLHDEYAFYKRNEFRYVILRAFGIGKDTIEKVLVWYEIYKERLLKTKLAEHSLNIIAAVQFLEGTEETYIFYKYGTGYCEIAEGIKELYEKGAYKVTDESIRRWEALRC